MTINLGELSDKLYKLDEEIDKLNAKLNEVKERKKLIENEMFAALDDSGTDIARGKKATVSISVTERPGIKDFVLLEPFVYRHKALYLFERRIAAKAHRELVDSKGKPIPGIEVFQQRRLNVRKV
jgi:hypothetical protein